MNRFIISSGLMILVYIIPLTFAQSETDPLPNSGALEGDRYRVFISSDIGGRDEDDIQSMVHYLVYSDLFDTEGLVSSPPYEGRKEAILEVIDVYAQDYEKLKKHANYPHPDSLRKITRQGATEANPAPGYARPTEGSQWLIECAHRPDPRSLYVLVWGGISDVAQAVHDDPSIKEKIRVHYIASWNRRNDEQAFDYLDTHHRDLWIIQNETTFRGWYMGGNQKDDLGNRTFIEQHLKGHGALGDYIAPLKKGAIKMGDTPTVAWLLRGNPADPTQPGWGGQFILHPNRPHWYIDNPDPALAEGDRSGAKTVNRWREAYLRDWQQRMDRCK